MWSTITRWFNKPDYSGQLASILAEVSNREDILGMKTPLIPTPEGIRLDASKLAKYTESSDYKKFAEEAWGRVISHLDKILDDKSTNEVRQYYCGATRATLDLLRLSHQARYVIDEYEKEQKASSRPMSQKRG